MPLAMPQPAENHPLEGGWDITQNQNPPNWTGFLLITWDDEEDMYVYTRYDAPGGTVQDTGTIDKITGGWQWDSNNSTDNGPIQHQSGDTYAWSSNQTGQGGTLDPHH